MEAWLESGIAALLGWLAIPKVGLSAVFLIAFISATLLPLGSEPAVFGLVKLHPEQFWPAILVATLGNTLGGLLTWWMGLVARRTADRVRPAERGEATAARWLAQYGPKACLLAWLPIVGDPLCAVAGWLQLPFGPCAFYMAVGKLARYITMTSALLWVL